MNFGDYFIKCIKTMYKDIKAFVANNGYSSELFTAMRGIRQGYPISVNLFIHAIRRTCRITGLMSNNTVSEVVPHVDDICLFLEDQGSLHTALIVFEHYTKRLGLKVNTDKSEAIWIGASSNF